MAWSWSHSPEAYSDAYDNLHDQPHAWLAECLAEWQASKPGQYGQRHLRLARWEKNLAWCTQQSADVLADMIWEKMSEQQTCDNGGFNAWACPFGCHKVSFSCSEVEGAYRQ
ncbi:MAG: hypothetical protein ABSH36_08465 [Solirubrobacteraceae bacterium]|jgi:hypothetical protein